MSFYPWILIGSYKKLFEPKYFFSIGVVLQHPYKQSTTDRTVTRKCKQQQTNKRTNTSLQSTQRQQAHLSSHYRISRYPRPQYAPSLLCSANDTHLRLKSTCKSDNVPCSTRLDTLVHFVHSVFLNYWAFRECIVCL